MGEYQRRINAGGHFEAALLICGRKDKYTISNELKDMIVGNTEAPVMVIGEPTNEAMKMIHQFTPKLNFEDIHRVSTAVEHYEPYIDFDELLRRTTSGNSSFNDPTSVSFDQLRSL